SLETYSNRPDCFRAAAKRIQTRCSELEIDEGARVQAALSMTLCEIATAEHNSPPMECASFGGQDGSRGDTTARQCVSALSRSAQYWSSYSGYLREVAQLCFAFQRWNDIDTAKQVHRNATMEAILALRVISDQRRDMQTAWDDSSAILQVRMQL
ncbi:uncharacterized protein BXZ73DRAFT_16469, partial [Epithele typhae]|uniref:uncharacterized protein n=1 Tax=Epithele typhae TaxID=378194 RepID=UPI0020077ABF